MGGKEIVIEKPCSLVCFSESLNPLIYFKGGGLYYERYLPATGLKFRVNIPDKGTFILKGFKILSKEPLTKIKPLSEIADYERNISKPDYKIKEVDQFSPASIHHSIAEIRVNKKFKHLNYHFQVFIMLHELAHRFYKTEWKCDLWALSRFSDMGYNSSNAFYCLTRVLKRSREKTVRVKKLFNNIQKQKTWLKK